ncbi:tetratricopeptide repeat protein [Streptomyces eurythermus]|uniref:tetratricopeptide repeat protein n=1 Tax=Streptomyces eurythermus TaxID=42237 RepID=UPI0036D20FA8
MDPAAEGGARSVIHLISGLGGVGKTELASQVAHQAHANGWFTGGVLFIDLFGYDAQRRLSPERALVSLLQAVGAPEDGIPEDLQGKARLYRSILAANAQEGARILVLIDNASSAEQVIPLLPTDGVNVSLVTSRHNLSIGARLHELEVLDPESAVDLLRAALEAGRGESDARIDQNTVDAHELARLCGFLPLALQICSAILADSVRRPLSSLVRALEESHRRLDELQREEMAVRGVFDLSYALLSEREKQLLGFISFSPGADISTAAAARLVDKAENEVERELLALSRAHLVEHGAVWGRWRLHDLLRLYALEKSEELPGQQDAVVRLFDYYRDYAREANDILAGRGASSLFSSRDSAFEWFDMESPNMIAAVHIAARQPALAGYAAEMPHRLARYFDIRRLFSDWKELMEVSLAILRETDYKEFEANALDSLGMACRELHQTASAISFQEEAVCIARDLGNKESLARYLNNLGNSLFQAREFQRALLVHSEAAELFIEQGDRLGCARATDNAASALRELGRPDDAVNLHEQAIGIFREADAAESLARALSHMGSTLLEVERFSEAVTAQKESVELLKALGLLGVAAHTLLNLSNALRAVNDIDGSLTAARESLSIHESIDDAVGVGTALNQIGLLYTDLSDFDQAYASFRDSLHFLSGSEGLIGVGYAYANLGRLYAMHERIAEALESLEKASAVFSRCNAPGDLAMVKQLMGVLSLAMTEGQDGG